MAKPLTNIQEPGFFSRIEESPSLFLTPGSTQVVGIIGEGKSTKTISDGITRSASIGDKLTKPIWSISLASSNFVFRYPQSSYSVAIKGTADLSAGATVNSLDLKITVDGLSQESHVFSGADPISLSDVAIEINGAMANVTAEADGNFLLIYSNTAASFTVDDGLANAGLGLEDFSRADSVRWDPVVVDPEFAPQAAETYSIDYESPKVAADFSPKQLFNLSQVVEEYGDVTAANSLSLGAAGAFGNGASIVNCRQLDPSKMVLASTASGEIKAALKQLEDYDLSVLVPMVAINAKIASVDVGMDSEYLDHVSKMSSKLERKERICILGMDEKAARLDILGPSGTWQSIMAGLQPPASAGLAPKRVMVVSPGRCLTSSRGAVIEADGTYAAACLAGRMVNSEFDEAESMTRKTLATIDELITPDLSRPEKNQLTSLGVTVIESKNSLILVRRAVTADSTSIASQEPSIVRSFDLVASSLRESMENRFTGTKILNTTGTSLEAAASIFLERFIAEEIITSYKNVKATQNKVEPRQFDIKFEAAPVFPFIWGVLDISIVLS